MAATPWYLDLAGWLAILKVAVGLGMVIFVHELGHFVVAKLCGVKCEKFYLGFDIFGLKIGKFTWGETEYGIGILPLGGYVKMLGQEDNPARLQEEIERAKQKQAGEPQADSRAENPSSKADDAEGPAAEKLDAKMQKERPDKPAKAEPAEEEEIDVAAAEAALYDPRSYLAKSVPKRMAIISAGVIMNLIFAFVCACIAFGMGVKRLEPVVGQVVPGKGAWRGDAKLGPNRSGDHILQVNDREIAKFRDFREEVIFGDDIENGIRITARREGVEKPITFRILPDESGMFPVVGIASPHTTTIWAEKQAICPESAAGKCRPKLEPGDKIKEINGEEMETGHQLDRFLASHPEEELTLLVERPVPTEEKANESSTKADPKTFEVQVDTNPMRRLGLEMGMGAICGIQYLSPAALAKIEKNGRTIRIQKGDRIVKIDGRDPGDPMTLASRLQKRAGETIDLTVRRVRKSKKKGDKKSPGKHDDYTFSIELREVDWLETPVDTDDPMSVPALGVAFHVSNRVRKPLSGFPAAGGKKPLQAGDRIIQVRVIPPNEKKYPDPPFDQEELELTLDDENRNWPVLIYLLQKTLPHTEVELTWLRSKKKLSHQFSLKADKDWLNPERGFRLGALSFVQKAETFGEAVELGADETVHSTLLVYRFLQKLGSQISPTAMGGPISIFRIAKIHAEQGTPELLLFLTMLSANLAVINFLPIPLLDGGHMVFLTWEGVRGKPAGERIQLVLTYFGLLFILSLMLWVIGLDIYRLF